MSLNIKNPETHRLAAKLTKRKGQSMTEVITDAPRSELAASDPKAEARKRAERAMAIAREMNALIGPEGLPDHGQLLYDSETALPK